MAPLVFYAIVTDFVERPSYVRSMPATASAEPLPYQTRVYRFRLRDDLPEAAIDELRRCHDLSNKMIEIEMAYAERVTEVWRTAPSLLQLEQEVTDLDEAVGEIASRVKKQRQRSRSTKIDPVLKKELAEARKALRDKKTEHREEKARLYPLLVEDFHKLADGRRQAMKDTYRPAIDGGLYWANYNEVRDRHEAAAKAVRTARKQGRPADLRFRRWTGEGTLVVQLQRQAGMPPRTPAVIADPAGKYRNVAHLTPALDPTHWETLTRPQQRRARPGICKFRVGSGDSAGWCQVPVLVHRPVPPEADIVMMEINRRRIGRRFRCHVSVVVRLPRTPMRTEGHKVAMHVGWRSLSDQSLRVAVVSGIDSPPPDSLDEVVRMHDGWAEVVIPHRWRKQMDYVHSLASIRGKSLDVLKRSTLEWIVDHPDHTIAGIETIERWRSPARFAALAQRLRDDETVDPKLREQLEAWRVQDQHLWDIEENLRDKIIARRNNAFCNVAAWLLRNAGLLVIDNYNIQRIARKPDLAQEDSEAHRAARSNRVLAAPGKQRLVMLDGATRRGVHVVQADGTISGVHHICGEDLDEAEREEEVMVYCSTCQTMVDQDANSLVLLTKREMEPA